MFGALVQYLPPGAKGKRAQVDLPEGATVDGLADRLGMSEVPAVILINDEQHHRQSKLNEADVVTFLPSLAGGGCPLVDSGLWAFDHSALSHPTPTP